MSDNILDVGCTFRRKGGRFLEPGRLVLNYSDGLTPFVFDAKGNKLPPAKVAVVTFACPGPAASAESAGYNVTQQKEKQE